MMLLASTLVYTVTSIATTGSISLGNGIRNFHPTLYNGCNYLSMLRLKLHHVGTKGLQVIVSDDADDFVLFQLRVNRNIINHMNLRLFIANRFTTLTATSENHNIHYLLVRQLNNWVSIEKIILADLLFLNNQK